VEAACAVEPSPEGLWAAWDEFSAALNRARGRAAQEQGGLTISQYHLLAAVDRMGTPRAGELASQLEVSAPTVTRMLSSLEAQGAVRRQLLPEDRRAAGVELTPPGRELLERKRAFLSQKRQALLESLSPAERRQAERLFRRFTEVIEAL
jgi:MarR family transcriptional regulator for hemolysin